MTIYSYDDIFNYVSEFEKENKFIDVGILLEMLNSSNLEYSQKYEILFRVQIHNLNIIRVFEKENKNLRNFQQTSNNNIPQRKIQNEIILPEVQKANIIKKVSSNYDIISSFESIDLTELEDYIKSCINNDDFNDLINTLLLNVKENIITIKKMKNEEYLKSGIWNNTFDEYLLKLNNILNILFKYQHYIINEQNNSQNTIIYLTTEYGNINIASDLKAIPIEFYDSFYILLNSIQNGTFKNLKRIGTQSNNYKTALLQVKENFTRVIFDQIEPNIYIILTMFVKKVSTSKDYHNNLKTVDILLAKQLPFIRNQLMMNRNNFLELNNNITQILFEKLLTKDMGVSINESINRKIKK